MAPLQTRVVQALLQLAVEGWEDAYLHRALSAFPKPDLEKIRVALLRVTAAVDAALGSRGQIEGEHCEADPL